MILEQEKNIKPGPGKRGGNNGRMEREGTGVKGERRELS